jgi:hypothetical protein
LAVSHLALATGKIGDATCDPRHLSPSSSRACANGDGAIRAYRPEDGPPDAGDLEGARVIMRKLPDGVVEQYDPRPETVRLFGPPGPDGLYTHPDGHRVRFVFTDGGAR